MSDSRELDPADDVALDFLLEEYKSHSEALYESEKTGEARVNFFLTVSTAILAGLLLGESSLFDPSTGVRVEVYLVLMALLLFGRLTLARVVHRNRVTDDQKGALAKIRGYYVGRTPELKEYLTWGNKPPKPRRPITIKQLFVPGRGGLVETVMLWNALIVAFFFGLGALTISGTMIAPSQLTPRVLGAAAAIIGLLVAWTFQCAMVKRAVSRPAGDDRP